MILPGAGLFTGLSKGQKEFLGMKVKASVKRRCTHCKIVKRHGRVFVICKRNPKHKQRQG